MATQPRREFTARANLECQGYKTLLPKVSLKSRVRGAWKNSVQVMFPGYVFVLLSIGFDDPAPIRSTVGCIGLVKFGLHPIPVPDSVMEPLIKLADSPMEIRQTFRPGGKVRFEDGPLTGLSGVLRLARGRDRVEVLMSLLGREIPIQTISANLSIRD